MNGRLLIIFFVLALQQGCSDTAPREHGDVRGALPGDAREVLETAGEFELISLEPLPQPGGENTFHGYDVLGRVKIEDQQVRAALVGALYKGIAENEGDPPACFNPRHGIRAVRDGKTVDVVICFECFTLKVYTGGGETGALTARSPEKLFNQTLREAGVALSSN